MRDSLAAWHLQVPRLRATGTSSRTRSSSPSPTSPRCGCGADGGHGLLPAAGMPWFMTVFGRDTLITCLQTMLLGPELAIASLEALAALQAREDDPSIDAEPGKILHELRRGRAAETWFGTLLRDGRRDAALPRPALRGRGAGRPTPSSCERLREPALRGARLDRRLRRPRRRRLRRVRAAHAARPREPVVEGLGRLAALPRRLVRADADRAGGGAGLRLRREAAARRARARGLGRPGARGAARGGGRSAANAASTTRYWVDERGGYYALALDGDKRRVDSLCSNHRAPALERDRPARAGRRRSRPGCSATRSGRAGASGRCRPRDAAYNPLSYHNGTVWPHDTSLAAWGLARAGRAADVWTIARALLEAARFFDWSLPEVFAGYRARRDAVPDRLPDRGSAAGVGRRHAGPAAAAAARPRARPGDARAPHDRRECCPSGSRASSCRACARSVAPGTWSPSRGIVEGDRDVKVAVLSPVWFPVPPSGYGGIEWIVSLLADGLADAGHDVTLFASGDSRTRAKLAAVFEQAPSDRIGQTFWELQHALQLLRAARRLRRHPRPHGPDGSRARLAPADPARAYRPRAGDGHPGDLYEQIVRMAPHAKLISLSLSQREPRPNLPWIANVPNALDLSYYPVPAGAGRLPALPRPDEPGQGRAPGGDDRARGGAAAEDRGQVRRAGRAGVLRRARATPISAATASTSAR